jgi:hypothetical protein
MKQVNRQIKHNLFKQVYASLDTTKEEVLWYKMLPNLQGRLWDQINDGVVYNIEWQFYTAKNKK